jgi:glycosyltransferase involved in cell wall biosynthesis
LIAAFARACADGSVDVRLVLVGGGPLDAELRDLCRTLGVANRVIFLGLRDDVPKILQALDGFVLNSDTEGLSYAVLEAMACSLPIIATEVGANPELIENGVHGWLYAVGDEVRLAELLAQAAREPDVLKACGARAREKAVGDYGLDRMAHAYAQFYHEVLSHSTASGAVMEGR